MENNFSETSFFVGSDGEYDLRWFEGIFQLDRVQLLSGYLFGIDFRSPSSVVANLPAMDA